MKKRESLLLELIFTRHMVIFNYNNNGIPSYAELLIDIVTW